MHNAYDEVITSYSLSSIGFNELSQKYRSHRTEKYVALSFAPAIETLKKELVLNSNIYQITKMKYLQLTPLKFWKKKTFLNLI